MFTRRNDGSGTTDVGGDPGEQSAEREQDRHGRGLEVRHLREVNGPHAGDIDDPEGEAGGDVGQRVEPQASPAASRAHDGRRRGAVGEQVTAISTTPLHRDARQDDALGCAGRSRREDDDGRRVRSGRRERKVDGSSAPTTTATASSMPSNPGTTDR
ncbi:MAG: hypothetical protein U0R65_02540 [Candidatus Nanopelagicales bacterium]